MAQQTINIGSVANDGTGDPLRTAFDKVNDNFTELYADDAGDVNSVNAGTGISVNQTTGAVTVTNSAPDQTVSLADGGNIGISGTYPSFTLTNSAPNATHTGDVTGATALTIADDVITYAKLANEFTATAGIGASDVDFSIAQVFSKTLTADTTFTFSNAQVGMVKDLIITGSFAPTFPAGSKVVAGTYNGAVSNLIQVIVAAPADYWLSISQAQ
jgi:hypothetical protein